MNSTAIYNKIGKTYDFTRRADPEILSRLIQHLSPIGYNYRLVKSFELRYCLFVLTVNL